MSSELIRDSAKRQSCTASPLGGFADQLFGGLRIARLFEPLLRIRPRRVQRVGQFSGVFSPRLRHLRSAAATAAGDFGGLADPVAGFEAFGNQIIAHGGDEAHLLAIGRGEQRGETRRALLDRIDQARS